MAENRQLISSYVVADDNGEEISTIERLINLPETISFPKNFCKVHHAVHRNMTDSQIGKFLKLTDHLEYCTNRLVEGSRGRKPIPLDQVMISHILKKTIRTTNTFMREMDAIKAIMKIDTDYHMSPRFASRASSLNTDIIIKMIKKDSLIVKAMDRNQWNRLKHFI
jgi:hypothetical protein